MARKIIYQEKVDVFVAGGRTINLTQTLEGIANFKLYSKARSKGDQFWIQLEKKLQFLETKRYLKNFYYKVSKRG